MAKNKQMKAMIDELLAHNLEMQKGNMELLARHFESTFRRDNPNAPAEDVTTIVERMRSLMVNEVRKTVLGHLERNPDEILDKFEEDEEY